ncbi:MAG: selenide, water dikinase SelD [Bacteroidetes bacterium]|nr:selenide, water dikinase SelD [Bacteroidota bacterium]
MKEVIESIRLTSLSHSSGCGCKVNASGLSEILNGLRNTTGFQEIKSHEDASIYTLSEEDSLLASLDFFMPIVDDEFDFGAIAAANALSDIYAMGGYPIQALSILGWPVSRISAQRASRVLEGAEHICNQAGISISGGHTIDSHEPFFGLSVNGLVKNRFIKKNSGPQQGDLLFLTKPIGSGMLMSALKKGKQNINFNSTIGKMKQLNSIGAQLGKINGVHAMTDITGFGLLGHAAEMTGQEKITLNIEFKNIPFYEGVNECMQSFIYPDITTSNFNWIKDKVNELSAEALFLLCDPQTSGGLLIAASPESAPDVQNLLRQHDCYEFPVGKFDSWNGKPIFVKDTL